MKRCKVCTLPENFPGTSLDLEGVCNFCNDFDKNKYEIGLLEKSKKLDQLLSSHHDEKKAYDCIVALSGGKDSCYTLMQLTKLYKLNCLAITVDNGFLSEQAIKNSQLICEYTGSDLIIFTPSFADFKAMYKETLNPRVAMYSSKSSIITRASQTCNSCINIINKIMLFEAFRRDIDLVAGGYIAGQIPDKAYYLEISKSWLLGSLASVSHNFIIDKLSKSKKDIENSLIDSVKVVTPLLAKKYNQNEIIKSLEIIGWSKPLDTGKHSSNCRLNDVGIMHHLKMYGFHPYQLEISEQVRKGELNISEALSSLNNMPSDDDLREALNKLI